MGKIIVLQSVKDVAVNLQFSNIVLFGETDFINDGNNIYDFLFYAKETHPYEVERIMSLVIPVLRVRDEDEAISRIYGLYLKYPNFSKYAVLEQDKNYFDFYEVCPKELGKEIKCLGKYNVVEENSLFSQSLDEQFKSVIEKKRSTIDAKYKNAAGNYN